MNRFWDVAIRPILDACDARRVLEIGAQRGAHSRLLADWVRSHGAELFIIEPTPQFDPDVVSDRDSAIEVDRRRSLEVLPAMGPVDVALIDGDHNYYTVRRELELLVKAASAAGEPEPVMVCHDVCWPYGRRDLYYEPEVIPDKDRHPWARMGIVEGQTKLVPHGGLNAYLANARHEGGPRNGVLTAIEDVFGYMANDWSVTILPVLYGLGILVPAARLARHPTLAGWLPRWHTAEGWSDLAHLADKHRRAADALLQSITLAGQKQQGTGAQGASADD